jgi:hypothetical protein
MSHGRHMHVMQSGLLVACLTSQTFYNPASDALWHTLDDLQALARCMPEHMWEESEQECENSIDMKRISIVSVKHHSPHYATAIWLTLKWLTQVSETLNRSSNEWLTDRFRLCASRVRELNVEPVSRPYSKDCKRVYSSIPSSRILEAWAWYSKDSPIFHRLSSIKYNLDVNSDPLDINAEHALVMLLEEHVRPSIRRFQVHRDVWFFVSMPPPIWTSALNRISDNAPDIETLVVEGDQASQEVSVMALMRLSNLRQLSLDVHLSNPDFLLLASLPRLESLETGIESDNVSRFPASSFPQLKRLVLRVPNLRWVTAMLSASSTTRLRVVDIYFLCSGNETREDISPLMACLSQHASRNSLMDVSVVAFGIFDEILVPLSSTLKFMETVGKLVSAPHLRTLRIRDCAHLTAASDSEYLQFLEAMPELEEMRIGRRIPLSLPAFAQLCAHRRNLCQSDFSLCPDKHLMEFSGTVDYNSAVLYVSDLTEAMVIKHGWEACAEAIYLCFPAVRQLQQDDWFTAETDEEKKVVGHGHTLVDMFKTIRRTAQYVPFTCLRYSRYS